MSGPEQPAEPDRPVEPEPATQPDGERDRYIREVSAELNRRSDFIQELREHAEKHRNRVPPPDQAG
jgi:hypothetical protein